MNKKIFRLSKLGLNPSHFKLLKNEIKLSQGMILVTGPTGSGKTTTLYTMLRMLNKENVNICTIEDPIEYGIDNVNQVQVKPNVGLTFVNGLRSLLRQDPNIIMVGEIRDKETASIAINAAMTGHLVLSTLHTNNSFLTPQRLVEMGVPGYLVSPVLKLVISQRLVRKICPHCRTRIRPGDKLLAYSKHALNLEDAYTKLQAAGLLPDAMKIDDYHFYKGKGCDRCGGTGFKGRMGIYEIIKVDDELRYQIAVDPSEAVIKKMLTGTHRMLTMAEDGILKIFNGITTFDEVLRVIKE